MTYPSELLTYHFRYRDQRTSYWVIARYRCEAQKIRTRYKSYKLVGAPRCGLRRSSRP